MKIRNITLTLSLLLIFQCSSSTDLKNYEFKGINTLSELSKINRNACFDAYNESYRLVYIDSCRGRANRLTFCFEEKVIKKPFSISERVLFNKLKRGDTIVKRSKSFELIVFPYSRNEEFTIKGGTLEMCNQWDHLILDTLGSNR